MADGDQPAHLEGARNAARNIATFAEMTKARSGVMSSAAAMSKAIRNVQNTSLANLAASDRAVHEVLNYEAERKAKLQAATLEGATSSRLTVKALERQEHALQGLSDLLGAMVRNQFELIEDQRRAAKSSRRWRLAAFIVAVCAVAASVAQILVD